MNEPQDIERLISALKKVPAKRLMIIELANRFTIDGQLDYDGLAQVQPEVNLAIAEAKMYGANTLVAVDTLKRQEAIPADVGPGHPALSE